MRFTIFITVFIFSLSIHANDNGVSYLGRLEGARFKLVRFWLKTNADNSVSGFYRYDTSKQNLNLVGKLDPNTNAVELRETDVSGKVTGQFYLVKSTAGDLSGKWISPDGKKSIDVYMANSNWIYLSDWNWLVPRKVVYEPTDTCKITRNWPGFSGFSSEIIKKLDVLFAPKEPFIKAGYPEFCKGQQEPFGEPARLELFSDYMLLGYRNQLLSLSMTEYEYNGGAHGQTTITCKLIDMKSGEEVDFKKLIDKKKLHKLRILIENGLAKIHSKEEMPYWASAEKIDKIVQELPLMCLQNQGAKIQFGSYEVAPYAAGLPSIDISEADLRELLLPENPIAKRIFNP